MAFPVTVSGIPLDMGTLPAVKVCRYRGHSADGKVYSYARMYVLDGALAFALYAFERQPAPESRVELALAGENGACLVYSLAPHGAQLWLDEKGQHTELPVVQPAIAHQADEQGWSWSAETQLPPEALARAGITLGTGSSFHAAVFKTRTDEEAFGASFLPSADGPRLDVARFGRFEAVNY